MKKLTEVELFVGMLEHSDEVFRTVPVENETHVKFQDRKIIFIFNKQGLFLRITNLKEGAKRTVYYL